MSNYSNKGLVNRYWKRPKPKIYECNIRDAERFYKDSYNEYLKSKHFYASHGTNPTNIEEDFATKWTLSRVNSRLDSDCESTRARDSSLSGYNADYNSLNRDDSHGSQRVAFSRHDSLIENNNSNDIQSNLRSKSMGLERQESNLSSETDIESRLERIRKLKAELGLLSNESTEDFGQNSDSKKSILKKSYHDSSTETRDGTSSFLGASSSRARKKEPSIERNDNLYSYRSERANRFRTDGQNTDDYDKEDVSSYSSRKRESASRSYANNSSNDSSARNYRDIKERNVSSGDNFRRYTDKKGDTADDYSSKFRSKNLKFDDNFSSKSTLRKTSNENGLRKGDHFSPTEDDDEVVTKLRRKFPTSEEILERIKKMDSDL